MAKGKARLPRKPFAGDRSMLTRLNNPPVSLELEGTKTKDYMERLFRLHRPVGHSNPYYVFRSGSLSGAELRKNFDANLKFRLRARGRDAAVYRSINQNLPLMRRVLITNEKSERRRKALRAFFDSFYVREYGTVSKRIVDSSVIFMNKTMWRRYDRLLRAANRILQAQGKPILW